MTSYQGNPVANLSEYETRHLVAHLVVLEQPDDLHNLLKLSWIQEINEPINNESRKNLFDWLQGKPPIKKEKKFLNAWYENKEVVGDTTGYISDIERAWKLAEKQYSQNLSSKTQTTNLEENKVSSLNSDRKIAKTNAISLALQIRYALILASLNDLARNVPPALLISFIVSGAWSLAQGLAYARRIPEPVQRAQALTQLANQFFSELGIEIYQEALTALHSIKEEENLVKAIIGIVPSLPDSLSNNILTIAKNIKNNYQRAIAIANISQIVPESSKLLLTNQALESARNVPWVGDRVSVLLSISKQLSETQKRIALQNALSTARLLPEKGGNKFSPRGIAIAQVSKKYAEFGYFDEALSAFWAIQNSDCQLLAFSELVELFPREVLLQIEPIIWTMQNENHRWCLLAILAPFLIEQDAKNRSSYAEEKQANTIIQLAPYLPPMLRPLALSEVLNLQNNDVRLLTLTNLAREFSGPLRANAINEIKTLAKKISSQNISFILLAKISPQLAKLGLQVEAIRIARLITDNNARSAVLAGLMPHFSTQLKYKIAKQILSASRNASNKALQISIVTGILSYLDNQTSQKIISEIHSVENKLLRLRIMAIVAKKIASQGKIRDSIKVAQSLEFSSSQAQAMTGIIPHVPNELRIEVLEKILSDVLTIDSPDEQLRTFLDAIPYMPNTLLNNALVTLKSLKSLDTKSSAIAYLAPRLTKNLLQDVISFTNEFQNVDAREAALSGLFLRLTELGSLEDALVEIEKLYGADAKAASISSLGPRFAKLMSNHIQDDELRHMVKPVGGPLWWQAADLIGSLTGFDRAAERADALYESRAAKKSINRNIELNNELLEKSLHRALVIANGIPSENARTSAIETLVPYLTLPLLNKTLNIAENVNEANRAQIIVSLSPHLSIHLQQKAETLARTIYDHNSRARALLALAYQVVDEEQSYLWWEALAAGMADIFPELPTSLRESILEKTILATESLKSDAQAHVLNALAPFLPNIAVKKLTSRVRTIGDEHYRNRVITELAENFPSDLLNVILNDVSRITDNREKALALVTLLKNVPEETFFILREDALKTIRGIEYRRDRAQLLLKLLDYIPKQQKGYIFTEALVAGKEMQINAEKSIFLAKLSNFADSMNQKREIQLLALNTIREIDNLNQRAYTLMRIAPLITDENCSEELQTMVGSIEDPSVKAVTYWGISACKAQSINESDFEQVLTILYATKDLALKIVTQIQLLPHVPDKFKQDFLFDAFRVSISIQDTLTRTELLELLIPFLKQLPISLIYELWCEALPVIASRTRDHFLSDIISLLPVIIILGDQQEMLEIYNSILDTGKWWP